MTDDHAYCETCGRHSAECWCHGRDAGPRGICETPDAHDRRTLNPSEPHGMEYVEMPPIGYVDAAGRPRAEAKPDLATWLLQQIAEDERLAHDFVGRAYHEQWDQDRVLAECDAKRKIIDRCIKSMDDWVTTDSGREDLTFILATLAVPYSGRPGYREEWRPDSGGPSA